MCKYFFLVQCLIVEISFCSCNNVKLQSSNDNDSNLIHSSKDRIRINQLVDVTEVEDTNNTEKLKYPLDSSRGLLVNVSQSDTFDIESDTEYGVGDDDIFRANDFEIYK